METILSSDRCALLFDSTTGSLIGMRDLERKVRLVDPAPGHGPPLALDGIAPALSTLRLCSSWGGSRLRMSFDADGLELIVNIFIAGRSARSLWTLDLRNPTARARDVSVDFPLIRGTGDLLFGASPGCPVPWIAVTEPSRQAGMGLIVRQVAAGLSRGTPELRADAGVVRAALAGPIHVPAGRCIRAARAALLASEPDWRPTARETAAWLGRKTVVLLPEARGLSPDQLLALRLTFPGSLRSVDDPVRGSLAGLGCSPGDGTGLSDPLARHWMCARESAQSVLEDGEVLGDPKASDPAVLTRMFAGPVMDAVVCARLPEPGEEAGVAGFHAPYEVRIPVRGAGIPEVAVCDLEDLSWQRHVPLIRDGCFTLDVSTNWLLCLVLGRRLRLIGFDPLPEPAPGGAPVLRVGAIAGAGRTRRVLLRAPGLRPTVSVSVGSEVEISVPPSTRPGWYPIRLDGWRVPRFTRYLHVLS